MIIPGSRGSRNFKTFYTTFSYISENRVVPVDVEVRIIRTYYYGAQQAGDHPTEYHTTAVFNID
eukprot:SAG31_NODE_211_length_20274_cov_40.333482_19_plen_64_part_00